MLQQSKNKPNFPSHTGKENGYGKKILQQVSEGEKERKMPIFYSGKVKENGHERETFFPESERKRQKIIKQG